jgi:hypothetical protein
VVLTGRDDFARWSNQSDVVSLNQIPDFIGAGDAIHQDADKQTALAKMDAWMSPPCP